MFLFLNVGWRIVETGILIIFVWTCHSLTAVLFRCWTCDVSRKVFTIWYLYRSGHSQWWRRQQTNGCQFSYHEFIWTDPHSVVLQGNWANKLVYTCINNNINLVTLVFIKYYFNYAWSFLAVKFIDLYKTFYFAFQTIKANKVQMKLIEISLLRH